MAALTFRILSIAVGVVCLMAGCCPAHSKPDNTQDNGHDQKMDTDNRNPHKFELNLDDHNQDGNDDNHKMDAQNGKLNGHNQKMDADNISPHRYELNVDDKNWKGDDDNQRMEAQNGKLSGHNQKMDTGNRNQQRYKLKVADTDKERNGDNQRMDVQNRRLNGHNQKMDLDNRELHGYVLKVDSNNRDGNGRDKKLGIDTIDQASYDKGKGFNRPENVSNQNMEVQNRKLDDFNQEIRSDSQQIASDHKNLKIDSHYIDERISRQIDGNNTNMNVRNTTMNGYRLDSSNKKIRGSHKDVHNKSHENIGDDLKVLSKNQKRGGAHHEIRIDGQKSKNQSRDIEINKLNNKSHDREKNNSKEIEIFNQPIGMKAFGHHQEKDEIIFRDLKNDSVAGIDKIKEKSRLMKNPQTSKERNSFNDNGNIAESQDLRNSKPKLKNARNFTVEELDVNLGQTNHKSIQGSSKKHNSEKIKLSKEVIDRIVSESVDYFQDEAVISVKRPTVRANRIVVFLKEQCLQNYHQGMSKEELSDSEASNKEAQEKLQLYMEFMNKTIPEDMEIVFLPKSAVCESKSRGLSAILDALAQDATRALIGSLEEDLCDVTSRLADMWGKPLLSWSCPQLYRGSPRLIPSLEETASAIVTVARTLAWKSVVIITTDVGWWPILANKLEVGLQELGVAPRHLYWENEAHRRHALRGLHNTHARVIILCSTLRSTMGKTILEAIDHLKLSQTILLAIDVSSYIPFLPIQMLPASPKAEMLVSHGMSEVEPQKIEEDIISQSEDVLRIVKEKELDEKGGDTVQSKGNLGNKNVLNEKDVSRQDRVARQELNIDKDESLMLKDEENKQQKDVVTKTILGSSKSLNYSFPIKQSSELSSRFNSDSISNKSEVVNSFLESTDAITFPNNSNKQSNDSGLSNVAFVFRESGNTLTDAKAYRKDYGINNNRKSELRADGATFGSPSLSGVGENGNGGIGNDKLNQTPRGGNDNGKVKLLEGDVKNKKENKRINLERERKSGDGNESSDLLMDVSEDIGVRIEQGQDKENLFDYKNNHKGLRNNSRSKIGAKVSHLNVSVKNDKKNAEELNNEGMDQTNPINITNNGSKSKPLKGVKDDTNYDNASFVRLKSIRSLLGSKTRKKRQFPFIFVDKKQKVFVPQKKSWSHRGRYEMFENISVEMKKSFMILTCMDANIIDSNIFNQESGKNEFFDHILEGLSIVNGPQEDKKIKAFKFLFLDWKESYLNDGDQYDDEEVEGDGKSNWRPLIIMQEKKNVSHLLIGDESVLSITKVQPNFDEWFKEKGLQIEEDSCDGDFCIRAQIKMNSTHIIIIIVSAVVFCLLTIGIALIIRNILLKKRLSKGPNKIVLTATDFVFPQVPDSRRVDEGIEAMLCCWLQQLQEFGGPEVVDKPDLLKGSVGSLGQLGQQQRGPSSNGSVARGNQIVDHRIRYNGDLVQLKELPTVGTFELKSKAMDCLVLTHGLRHENLNPFIGCLTDPSRPALVHEHCSRGSLEDVLMMDEIKLDWTFRLSLLTDLVRGMRYLHSTPLKVHGYLTSRNCVIDARWVLKVTDYGLPAFYEAQGIPPTSKNARDLLWTAPELLRHCGLRRRGTQPGDVYSFGIIMQEVVVRGEPFCMLALSPEDIIEKVKKPPPLIRPSVSKGAAPPDAIHIMRQCWTEQPDMRPDFCQVHDLFRKLNHGRKVNFVDTMFQMLEKYSNNLEELIRERTEQLDMEKKKTEQLLNRMLPSYVAEKLKLGMPVDPEEFSEVSIYFSDIVGFTAISAHCTPFQVVDLLNDLYTCFDATINAYNVYKVETIGDAYMVVGGLPVKIADHAEQVATMALDLLHQSGRFKIRHLPRTPLHLRIGLHTGPCCAGVVGLTMPRYCLFGDTVNTASRMESTGSAWRIHLSQATRDKLEAAGGYSLEYRGRTEVKGKGRLPTYWLLGKAGFDKALPSPPPIGLEESLTVNRCSSPRIEELNDVSSGQASPKIITTPSPDVGDKPHHFSIDKSFFSVENSSSPKSENNNIDVKSKMASPKQKSSGTKNPTVDRLSPNIFTTDGNSINEGVIPIITADDDPQTNFDQICKADAVTNVNCNKLQVGMNQILQHTLGTPVSASDVAAALIGSSTTSLVSNRYKDVAKYKRSLMFEGTSEPKQNAGRLLKRQFSLDRADDSGNVIPDGNLASQSQARVQPRLCKQNSAGAAPDLERIEEVPLIPIGIASPRNYRRRLETLNTSFPCKSKSVSSESLTAKGKR